MYRRTVVSIPCGPSALAVKEAAWGLARYAAISQVCLNAIPTLYLLANHGSVYKFEFGYFSIWLEIILWNQIFEERIHY